MKVALSLGSNIDRYRHITAGLDALKAEYGEVVCSPVYESAAVGFDGSAFLNLIALVETDASVTQINAKLKEIEDTNGRVRSNPKFSSRTLDIDVVTYGDACGEIEGVELPRAELFKNAFVLLPMKDLMPNELVPGSKQTYSELCATVDFSEQQLKQVAFNWP